MVLIFSQFAFVLISIIIIRICRANHNIYGVNRIECSVLFFKNTEFLIEIFCKINRLSLKFNREKYFITFIYYCLSMNNDLFLILFL